MATHRRNFLKTSAVALAAPTIVPASVFAKPGQPAPSDKVIVGCIGTGDLGRRHHLNGKLIPNARVQVAAVCDVDRNRRDGAAADVLAKTGKRVSIHRDFRDLCDQRHLDAVLIATPDHWHTLPALYAIQSGKDVYCEKPLTLTIQEGQRLVEVTRRYGAVFQTGSQQRSDNRFRQACELARNGKLGELQTVETHIGGVDAGKWEPYTTAPPELDWNFWLGQAPYVPYSANRCHYLFRWYNDYSGGKLTDWGAHHNDIAQWGIGADGSGPVKVKGTGTFHEDGPQDAAASFDIEYTYANGVKLFCRNGSLSVDGYEATKEEPKKAEPKDYQNGVRFTGSKGWVFVDRGRIIASDPELLLWKPGENDVRLEVSADHHNNWLDCIASRERPICDVEVGHRSVTVCHLGNIAVRLGRELNWDPKAEQFVGDDQANSMTRRAMRAPWKLT